MAVSLDALASRLYPHSSAAATLKGGCGAVPVPDAILDTSRDTGTRHFTATLCRVGCRPCARYAAHDRRRNEHSLDESSFASLDDLLCIARGCAMREFRGANQDRRGAAVLGRRRVVRPAGQARA